MGHQAKFGGKNKCFVHVLYLVRAILRRLLTSGTLNARLLLKISIYTADACIFALSCVGYVRARLKTRLSILKGNCGAGDL